ncbi:hypothetical protein ACTNEU_10265 [Ellagibacter isourolithinifaciens]|uniref:hypothetical protein n=1 Tax=Ellagibacter isourolithinifaciens TaxID=2137581 RepID=UPI003F8A0179
MTVWWLLALVVVAITVVMIAALYSPHVPQARHQSRPPAWRSGEPRRHHYPECPECGSSGRSCVRTTGQRAGTPIAGGVRGWHVQRLDLEAGAF